MDGEEQAGMLEGEGQGMDYNRDAPDFATLFLFSISQYNMNTGMEKPSASQIIINHPKTLVL